MRKILILLILLTMTLIFSGSTTYRRSIDFSGKRVGIIKSSVLSGIVKKRLDGRPILFSTMNEAMVDLRAGKIDGFIMDYSIASAFVEEPTNADLRVIEIPDSTFKSHIGACSSDKIIIERFNKFLTTLQDDGTLDEMKSRWFKSDSEVIHPDIKSSGLKGTLNVATSSHSRPFAYKENDEYIGFSVELIKRFAADLEFSVEFEDLLFHEMIPAVKNNQVDIAISNITISPERKKIVIFSVPYYNARAGMIIRN